MPASPAMRFSPGREQRADNHKRGRSLENGILFKERDDDLALFSEVQSKERDNFLLQSNDDFEDTFVNKLRDFSDHKLGVNITARGETSDFLNTEEEKNDYEWLITPPDTPLFSSLDDEPPQVILPQRGRPRAQPISFSRSSTMEKSHRSSRGSPSPNRLSQSPRSRTITFQPHTTTASKRPSSPSPKPSTPPPPRSSTPTSRRLSTGSTSTTTRGISGISPVKTTRGNSASPKIRAWQANIPGFSTEAPPNLRTSLADRPASYVRGSSPASRSSRQSMSPTPSRSIGSSHSRERERLSPRSKGSIVSSVDDDVESVTSVGRKVTGFRNNYNINNNNNKASFSQKPNRMVIASPAPKRSFDMALRQMDHKRGPQNMFRPLLSSVPSTTLYAGKPTSAWNSSVTTSSNASSDVATSYAHELEETELNDDDATSEYVNVPDSTTVDDQAFTFEKTDSVNEDMENQTHEVSPCVQLDDFKDVSENIADCDTETSVVVDDSKEMDGVNEVEMLKDASLCSRCGCRYADITPTEDEIKLCENCQNLQSSSTTDNTFENFQAEVAMSDEDHESFNTVKPQMNPIEVETLEVTQFEQHEDLVKDGESTHEEPIFNALSEPQLEEKEPTEVNHQVISQPSYNDAAIDQIQHTIDFQDSKVDSSLLNDSNTVKVPVIRSGNFSASSISYDDLSYIRESTTSMRSSTIRGSLSASSSFDFGPSTHTDTRFNRQLSTKKSEIENYKHRRSMSSLSGTSSHAFRPSSVGTSTLDSFEVSNSNPHSGKDLADVSSADPHENVCENDSCNEIGLASELQMFGQTGDAESLDCREVVGSFEKDEDLEEEDKSVDFSGDVVEVELSVISEGEVDHTSCCSSPVSQCDVSQNSEGGKEEVQEITDLTSHGKDVEALTMDGDMSNHASGIIEESLVVIEGEGTTKGRSLTLEEATDTILFCSSLVHNLAYEAATIAIDNQTPPHPDPEPSGNNTSFPLIPAIGKGKKDPQTKKPSKRSSKSQKTKKKNTTTKASNNTSTGHEETDVAATKPRIVFPNNKENRRPLELESKCNCSIM